MPTPIRLVAFFALVALSACGGGGEPTVGMGPSQAFQPEKLTVPADSTITFKNDTDEAHTVTAYEDGLPEGADYFSSGGSESEEEARAGVADELMEAGDTYEVTFDVPGTYRYFCIPHEQAGMRGTIVVE